METLEEPRITRHRLTVDEYERMAEVGVLAPDARLELIDGEIIDMAPIGTQHYWTVGTLHRLLQQAVGNEGWVISQSPLRLSAQSQPEPDLVVLKPQVSTAALPGAADVFLVIEVSDTTLSYDVRVKAPLYARHGVPECWVFDLTNQQLRVFRQPQGDTWGEALTLPQPGRIALPGLAGVDIDLGGVFQRSGA